MQKKKKKKKKPNAKLQRVRFRLFATHNTFVAALGIVGQGRRVPGAELDASIPCNPIPSSASTPHCPVSFL
jgi:hypothetical protein